MWNHPIRLQFLAPDVTPQDEWYAVQFQTGENRVRCKKLANQMIYNIGQYKNCRV